MLNTQLIACENASEDDQGLEFGDDQSDQKSQSAENTPGSGRESTLEQTRRSKQLETIDEEEEGCYIKDSLAQQNTEEFLKMKCTQLQDCDLVVYRGRHYCGNKKFVHNFIKLFKGKYTPFLEHPLVHQSQIIDLEVAEEMMQ